MPEESSLKYNEHIYRMAELSIVDSIENLPGVDTLEGKIGPILSGNKGSAHYITMPPGMYNSPHTHPTESIIYTARGRWILYSEGQRHYMKEGSLFFMPPNVETGWEVPFDEPAQLLIVKFEGPKDPVAFMNQIEAVKNKLEDQYRNGQPFHFNELPDNHEARVFAGKLVVAEKMD